MDSYSDKVFVNCPFDGEYSELFDAIVFAILDCGFDVRCAKEVSDSDEIRLEKIIRLIRDSKYSIHDISRTELDPVSALPRFNMPFELGIYIGAKRFGTGPQKEKACLIMDKEKYRYQKFISDIAGQDIRSHQNDIRQAISCVRNWLHEKSRRKIPGSNVMWERYKEFRNVLPDLCVETRWNHHDLTFVEYTALVTAWLEKSSS